MAKLTRERKIEIYNKRKEGESFKDLSQKYDIYIGNLKHLVRLIDYHGVGVLRNNSNNVYTKELKESIINKVLIQQSITETSIEYGLSSSGILVNWIKSYKENNYVIVEKKGRKPNTMTKIKKESKDVDYDSLSDFEKIQYLENRNKDLEKSNLYLEAEAEYLKKITCRNSKEEATTKEKVNIINELRPKFPLKILLVVSRIAPSTYKYNNKSKDKDDKNSEVMERIKECFEEHKKRYGYRRITLELQSQGIVINHKKVKRLMKLMGLYGYVPKAKYRSYKGDMNGTVKDLLLEQRIDKRNHTTTYSRLFSTQTCNQIWNTDVTEFHIASGKLYLSPILDLHSREIISYNVSKSANFEQTLDMLERAFGKHKNLDNLIFQSDQGWQYQMRVYHQLLKERNIKQSMSRKGNCYDNSPIENFFGIMKKEMFIGHEYEFKALEDLEQSIYEYIDYYNNKRISLKLKGLTPVQYRNQS